MILYQEILLTQTQVFTITVKMHILKFLTFKSFYFTNHFLEEKIFPSRGKIFPLSYAREMVLHYKLCLSKGNA